MATAKELYGKFDPKKLEMNNLNFLIQASQKLIDQNPNGIIQPLDYKLALEIINDLIRFEGWMSSNKLYEQAFDEFRSIRKQRRELLKIAIPNSHKELRGIIDKLFGQ